MLKVFRTAAAEVDLLDIWSYIARDSTRAADGLLDSIAAACNVLADNPAAGRLREELAPNLRSIAVGKYIVFYRPAQNGIVVIRILHGARDLPALF